MNKLYVEFLLCVHKALKSPYADSGVVHTSNSFTCTLRMANEVMSFLSKHFKDPAPYFDMCGEFDMCVSSTCLCITLPSHRGAACYCVSVIWKYFLSLL